jgi:cephalosporin-C deacetylase
MKTRTAEEIHFVLTDMPIEKLREYRGSGQEPQDFDDFWQTTLAASQAFEPGVTVEPVESPVHTVRLFDVEFSGFDGQRVKAWLRVPNASDGPLPAIVEFVGYGGGRGRAEDNLFWSSCGFAHLYMDTRGQGATWSRGDTSDMAVAGSRYPGVMTAGIEDPRDYYYRRLIVDAVRATEVAASSQFVDGGRITVLGTSQGGGVALAVAALSQKVSSLVSYVPFLCDFPRSILITDAFPYKEISNYLAVHRDAEANVLNTLSYFDGVNFARRATVPAWFTTSLMDPVCPPSTVFAAFNNYAGAKELKVWSHNGHEGGQSDDDIRIAIELKASRGPGRSE